MYLNLIYVYLVTERRKCLFNGKLIQFGNLQTSFGNILQHGKCFTPTNDKENKKQAENLENDFLLVSSGGKY